MAYQAPRIISVVGQTVKFSHPEEVEGTLRTYLTADVAASGTSLTVLDNDHFADNDILRFDDFGDKRSELKDITSAPSVGATIAVTAVTFAHSANISITKMLFDQFEISGASTATGTKTVIATADLQANEKVNTYTSTTAYSYYFVRFYNSKASTAFYSAYSDAAISTDYASGTVAYLKKIAAEEIDVEIKSDETELVNHKFLDRQINLCLQDIRGKRNRWSWMQSINTDIGNLSYALRRLAMPSDIYDNKTNRSVESLRIGDGQSLIWIPWEEYLDYMEDVAHTQVATQAASGATSLVCDDTVDFDSTGELDIGTQTTSATFSANASNTFTIDTGDITATVPVDTDVWQGVTLSEPKYYTVADGYIYPYPVPGGDWDTQNVFMDYYTVITEIDSDGDSVEPIRWDAVKNWLCAAILKRKRLYTESQLYEEKYNTIIIEMLQKERSISTPHFSPALNEIYPTNPRNASTWNRRD